MSELVSSEEDVVMERRVQRENDARARVGPSAKLNLSLQLHGLSSVCISYVIIKVSSTF